MLQKLKKSFAVSSPIDLPPPPTVSQMMADLGKVRFNDPLLQLAPLNCFSADFGDKAEGISPSVEAVSRDLLKLSALFNEIRDADSSLSEKRMELQSLTSSAALKREELEGIVSWTTAEGGSDSDEKSAEDKEI